MQRAHPHILLLVFSAAVWHATAEYEQFLKEGRNSPRATSAHKALERLSSTQSGGAAPKL